MTLHHARPIAAPASRAPFRALWALLVLAMICGPVSAQSLPQLTGEGEEQSEATAPPLGERAPVELERVRGELEGARARLESATDDAAAKAAEEVQILERIESHLRQQIVTEQQVRVEEAAALDLTEQLATSTGSSEPPPYGFLVQESLRDQHRDEKQRAERLTETVHLASAALLRARESLDARQRAGRQAKEAAGSQAEPSPAALRQVRRTELETRAALELRNLRELELRREQAALKTQDLRVLLVGAELDFVASRTQLTEDDRERIKSDLSVRENRARSNAEVARRSREYATDRLLEAIRRSDEAGGNDPVLLAEVEAHRAEQDRRQRELDSIERRVLGLGRMHELWEQRFQIFQDLQDRGTVLDWCATAEAELDQIQIEERIAADYMSDARKKIVTLDAKIEATTSVEIVGWLRQQRTAEAARLDIFQNELTYLEELRRLQEKLLADVGEREAHFDVGEVLQSVWGRITRFWNLEIAQVEDRPITPGKLVWGLAILIFGGFLAKRMTRFIGKHILPNFNLNEGALHAFEALLFYVLVTTFALFALKVVNIPLTAFTILGGALAIGFGFGSQNIVNNFISGLVLLTEQPVRVGDLIQIDELHGTVQYIGLRSTRVRTGENVELIVPNSSFLEHNVVNWTLNDTKTRIKVAVGVAYGTNTRKVKDMLKRAVSEHGRVLKSPEPLVLFSNFGDNSLEFQVHFWIHMKQLMDQRRLESDIRFRIDSLCRDSGIVIAFPQRDVHLDTLSPVEVRMVPSRDLDEEEPETPPKVIP